MTNVTMAAIAKAVNKPESTIYRWKKENPELFEAVREYAARIAQASEPTCLSDSINLREVAHDHRHDQPRS